MKLIRELADARRRWGYWLFLGARDVFSPYRRSTLGIAWLYIQNALWFSLIGVIFVPMFRDVEPNYLSYFSTGYVLFQYISASLSGAANLFVANRSLLLSVPISPLSVLLRHSVSNAINMVMTTPLLFIVFFIDGISLDAILIWSLVGLVPLILATLFSSVVFSYIGAIWGDFSFLVQSAMRILFFGTPIIWLVEQRSGLRRMIAEVNPINHMINLVRQPIVDQSVAVDSYIVVAGVSVGLVVLSITVVELLRDKIMVKI